VSCRQSEERRISFILLWSETVPEREGATAVSHARRILTPSLSFKCEVRATTAGSARLNANVRRQRYLTPRPRFSRPFFECVRALPLRNLRIESQRLEECQERSASCH